MRTPEARGGTSFTIALTAHDAKSRASADADNASTRPSNISRRRMRRCDAPSERRTAISRWRATDRASIKLATLAQTMSRVSRPTALMMRAKK
jgi:hypothetical protein